MIAMKPETRELIITEARRYEFSFVIDTIQRGKRKPVKYKHCITMPCFLYDELRAKAVLDIVDLTVEQDAFFESNPEEVTISFVNLYAAEDFHRRIDRYLIIKMYGSYPLKRTGISQL